MVIYLQYIAADKNWSVVDGINLLNKIRTESLPYRLTQVSKTSNIPHSSVSVETSGLFIVLSCRYSVYYSRIFTIQSLQMLISDRVSSDDHSNQEVNTSSCDISVESVNLQTSSSTSVSQLGLHDYRTQAYKVYYPRIFTTAQTLISDLHSNNL